MKFINRKEEPYWILFISTIMEEKKKKKKINKKRQKICCHQIIKFSHILQNFLL